jgi:hypothetical protein
MVPTTDIHRSYIAKICQAYSPEKFPSKKLKISPSFSILSILLVGLCTGSSHLKPNISPPLLGIDYHFTGAADSTVKKDRFASKLTKKIWKNMPKDPHIDFAI